MKATMDFEKDDTKNLLAKLDFEFSTKQHLDHQVYEQSDIDSMYRELEINKKIIERESKHNRRQYNYYVEGKVRRMFTGGFLPTTFGLDESRSYLITDFEGTGKDWAYFEYWQKQQRYKITKAQIWNFIIRTGSVLGIALSVLKFLELMSK